MSFLTVHILTALPMHNLNRGADGLPKSQFDGGVQRARLSSQALKRPARVAFREATALGSVRTKNAAALILGLAEKWAAEKELALDVKAAQADIKKVLTALAKADKKRSDASGDTEDAEEAKDNILLFAQTELETLARAVVEKQQSTQAVTLDDFILDFRSPALDIAAFGRMFANRADRSTHAAVAVSHAITTHPMALTVDYFTAVDDAPPRVALTPAPAFSPWPTSPAGCTTEPSPSTPPSCVDPGVASTPRPHAPRSPRSSPV